MKLHNLPKSLNKNKKRVGRGNSSGHGSYSTRGMKGQKARSGVSGLKMKGMKHIILSTPKLRGNGNYKADNKVEVTLDKLNKYFKDGEIVSPETLIKKKIIKNTKKIVKLIVAGEFKVKLQVKGCRTSKGAKEAIEAVGGKVS